MRRTGMIALGAAAVALLAGPGTAWAQDTGATSDSTAVQADPAVVPDQSPATPSDSGNTSSVTPAPSDISTSTAGDTSSGGTGSTDPAQPATTSTDDADVAASTAAQPQAQPEASDSAVRTSVSTGNVSNCATASAIPRKVGPPGPGCTRVDGNKISSDPANPTVLPAINGVTVGIWTENTAQGPVVHWQVLSGSFSGTDAIDLKVKGGPDPNGFTCQITNATPTGVCHAPVNPHNGTFYGISHVEACPGSTTAPPVNTPGGTGGVAGTVGKGGGGGKNKQGVAGTTVSGAGSPAVAAAGVGAAPGQQLPFTGLQVLWLLIAGTGLLGGGALVRTRLD